MEKTNTEKWRPLKKLVQISADCHYNQKGKNNNNNIGAERSESMVSQMGMRAYLHSVTTLNQDKDYN